MAGGWIENGRKRRFWVEWETGDSEVWWALRPFIGGRVEDNRICEITAGRAEKQHNVVRM